MRNRRTLTSVALLAMMAALVGGLLAACGTGPSEPTSPPGGQAGVTAQPGDDDPLVEDLNESGGRSEGAGTPTSQQADATAARSQDTASSPAIDFGKFRQLLPKDAIRPIYEPRFSPGELTSLDREELVIGVEINGESKAYPIGPLRAREMVNDVVGGVPVLVTW